MRIHFIFPLAAIFTAIAPARLAHANVMIIIDKSAQQMTITVNGEDRYTWPVSTGRDGYDTPSGDFQPFRMVKDHYSREWDDAPMPNSIFFTKQGHAIHGTYEVRNLGRPVSHGCVRLAPQNAATLFALVKEEGVFNTFVRLKGETPKTNDLVASRGGANGSARNRDYARYYGTNDLDDVPPQRGYRTQYSSRSHYRQRPYPFYAPRYYYGRGFFGQFRW